jgi:hypothetical protein
MRTIVFLAVAALAGGPLLAAAEAAPTTTTEILQQRTADGRILLTDRPSAGAKTERSWKMDAEDPAAARRRALDVRLEAQLVSERIERRIARQERLADEESQRRGLALERQRIVAYDDEDPYADSLVVFAPARVHGPQRRHVARDGRPGAPRMSRFTGPAGPGSR